MPTYQRSLLFTFISISIYVLLAYWPLSSFQFAMKNDAFTDGLANRIFFSQALQAGNIPWWNPFLNFGFPIAFDPGFSFWNPITWFFGLIGYNAYTFTIELLLYLLIGTWGITAICTKYNCNYSSTLMMALSFACSGFFVGNWQHAHFITSVAFIPWLFYYLLSRHQEMVFSRNSVGLVGSGYMIVHSGHPAFTLALFYILPIFCLLLWNISFQVFTKRLLTLLLAGIVILLLSAPYLWGLAKTLPEISRNLNVLDNTQGLGTGFAAVITSICAPFATTIGNSDWIFFYHDVSMRNMYLGTITVLCSILVFKWNSNRFRSLIWLCLLLFCLLISFDYPLKSFTIERLPLLNLNRTNGQFRFFFIFFLLLYLIENKANLERAINSLHHYLVKKERLIFQCCAIAIVLITIVFIYKYRHWLNSELNYYFIWQSLGFWDRFLLPLSLLFSSYVLVILFLKKWSPNRLIILFCLEIFINTSLCLFVTGVGKTSVQQVQDLLHQFPQQLHQPQRISFDQLPISNEAETKLIGDAFHYNQIIGPPYITDYPVVYKNTDTYFKNHTLPKQHSWINSNQKSIVTEWSPNRIKLFVNNQTKDSVILYQNLTVFTTIEVNDKQIQPAYYANNFIAIPLLQEGENKIEIEFAPHIPIKYWIYCLLGLSTFLIMLTIPSKQTDT